MSDLKLLTEADHDGIAALLIGRRIVKAEMREQKIPGLSSWSRSAEGTLTLDDGTVVYVRGNDGGCSCSSGCYPLEHLASVPNVITSVAFEDQPRGDDSRTGEWEGYYSIFVYADDQRHLVARFEGTDGNGYYGTGYQLYVRPVGGAS